VKFGICKGMAEKQDKKDCWGEEKDLFKVATCCVDLDQRVILERVLSTECSEELLSRLLKYAVRHRARKCFRFFVKKGVALFVHSDVKKEVCCLLCEAIKADVGVVKISEEEWDVCSDRNRDNRDSMVAEVVRVLKEKGVLNLETGCTSCPPLKNCLNQISFLTTFPRVSYSGCPMHVDTIHKVGLRVEESMEQSIFSACVLIKEGMGNVGDINHFLRILESWYGFNDVYSVLETVLDLGFPVELLFTHDFVKDYVLCVSQAEETEHEVRMFLKHSVDFEVIQLYRKQQPQRKEGRGQELRFSDVGAADTHMLSDSSIEDILCSLVVPKEGEADEYLCSFLEMVDVVFRDVLKYNRAISSTWIEEAMHDLRDNIPNYDFDSLYLGEPAMLMLNKVVHLLGDRELCEQCVANGTKEDAVTVGKIMVYLHTLSNCKTQVKFHEDSNSQLWDLELYKSNIMRR